MQTAVIRSVNHEKTRLAVHTPGLIKSKHHLNYCFVFCQEAMRIVWYQKMICDFWSTTVYQGSWNCCRIYRSVKCGSQVWRFPSPHVLLGLNRIYHGWKWNRSYVGNCLCCRNSDTQCWRDTHTPELCKEETCFGVEISPTKPSNKILCDCWNRQEEWRMGEELLTVHWLSGFTHFRNAFLSVTLLKALQIFIYDFIWTARVSYVSFLKEGIMMILQLFLQWFKVHSPFTFSQQTCHVFVYFRFEDTTYFNLLT